MGRASSSKKVARAAKAAGQPGTSKSLVWPLSIGFVVLVGIGLIIVSASGRESSSAAPILGDHWHASYGVLVCEDFAPPFNDAVPDESGIHSHGDGLMHIHPFSTRYTGADATIGAFAETTGWELDDDALTLPNGEVYANGDDCGGEEGIVQLKVWDGLSDETGRVIESELADYAPQDGEILTIAFAPQDAELPKPPSAGTQPTDVAPAPGDTVPEGAPETIPTDEDAGTRGEPTDEPTDEPTGDTTDTSSDGSGDDTTGVTEPTATSAP